MGEIGSLLSSTKTTDFHAGFVFVLIFTTKKNRIMGKLQFPVRKIDMFTLSLIKILTIDLKTFKGLLGL